MNVTIIHSINLQKAGVKWAMGGRNKQKLENVRQNLCKIDSTIKV